MYTRYPTADIDALVMDEGHSTGESLDYNLPSDTLLFVTVSDTDLGPYKCTTKFINVYINSIKLKILISF